MTVGVSSVILKRCRLISMSVNKVGILWCILGVARLLCNPV